MTLYLTPVWYWLIRAPERLPEWLYFIALEEPGALPVLLQLFLAEFAIDGLKLAALNTPSMLNSSLSVVGGLILGDFAVGVGWIGEEVVFYMAFVALANFTQPSYELGYAFKFVRMLTLFLVWILGVWGFVAGMLIFAFLLITNSTVPTSKGYLYPIIPFSLKGILHYLYRHPKKK